MKPKIPDSVLMPKKVDIRKSLTPEYMKRAVIDTDGDGVINIRDCQPLNPRKQGFFGDIAKKAGSRIKSKVESYKEGMEKSRQERKQKSAYRKAAESKIQKAEQAAYYQAKEKERRKLAEEKAKIEREQEVRRIRQRSEKGSLFQQLAAPSKPSPKVKKAVKPAKRQSPYDGMFGGQMGIMPSAGGMFGQPPKPKTAAKVKRKTKKPRKRRKRKAGKPKYVIRGGKAYQLA